jgi:Domain of unknown function (DUF4175)
VSKDLHGVIRAARRRWRLRVLLHGLAVVGAGGVLAALIAAWGADHFRFSPTALVVFRTLVWGTGVVLFLQFVVRPMWRRITDQQVVLYLEEHEPTLDGAVLGALTSNEPAAGWSPALIERVVARAVERLAAVGGGRRIERPSLQRSSGVLAGATAVALAAVLLGPASLRTSLPFVVAPFRDATGTPYAIVVTPGDSTVARGADLRVGAALRNFTADDVSLVMRAHGATDWERVSMELDEGRGDRTALLFDVHDTTEYFVTAGGVRSPVYRIAVVDLPYVQTIALEYHFPAYTGLDPVRQENGGDIAALVGTHVNVEVVPTIPATAGALLVGADTIPLAMGPAGMTGEIEVRENGSYRVLLAGPDGRLLAASSEYFVDALDDQPPMVRISQPGRDVQVTSVDEVFAEVRAEDDYGLQQVELVYAVNGGAESTAVLYGGRDRLKEVTAGHTLYLEEMSLKPGDVIAYYARARDARRQSPPSVTDIYFVTVRPFDRRWRAADESDAGQGQGQPGSGASPGELSARQRDIIAATFRIVRDSTKYDEREWRDNLGTVTLMQGRLRQEVETLVDRLKSRGVAGLDSTFAIVAEALPLAAEAMQGAEEQLGRRDPKSSLSPEQRALQQLQRAEAAFRERQVTRGQGGSGGGGNATRDTDAEELAELFELDMDKMRNQYESVERGQRQEQQQGVDEALEKLRELARRQQQENERRRAQALGDPNAGGSAGQRRLAQEAEELQRRLERLAREQNNPELSDAARRLQDATSAMQRAAAGRQGTAQGENALDKLREAQRRLEGSRSADLQRDMQDALRRAEELVGQQQEVRERLRDMPADGAGRQEAVRRLGERKQEMADEVDRLESELDRLARDARGEQPDAADRLRSTVQGTRDNRLQDKIKYSREVVAQRSREYAEQFEESIADDLKGMRDGIADAAGRVKEPGDRQLGRALDRTRDVAQALESMAERAREGAGDSAATRNRSRQLRDELRRRLGELRDVREQLNRAGADVGPLDDMVRRLGRLDARGMIGTPQGLDELSQAIVQGLKDYEFALRRQLLGADAPAPVLTPGEDVPAQYRALVEEYYRRLSERRR